MPIPSGKVECPDCGIIVQAKNLRKHYRKAHPGLDPQRRFRETRERKPRRKKMEVSPSHILGIFATVLVVTMLIITGLFIYSIYFEDAEAGLREEDVFFSADDGFVIHATFYHARDPEMPTIYLIHDIGSDRSIWVDHARGFQSRGYNVMSMDLRGHGESQDSFHSEEPLLWQDMGHSDFLQFSADITAAYRWVQGDDIEGDPNTKAGTEGAMIGIGKGGLYVLDEIARMARERMMAAVVLSPTLDCYDLDVIQVTEDYGDLRPLIFAAREGDGTGETAIDTILELKQEQDETNGYGIYVDVDENGIALLSNDEFMEFILERMDSIWGFDPQ